MILGRHSLALLLAIAGAACGDAQHSAVVSLPESPFSMRVVLTSSHPFLAEYDRAFTIEREGRAIAEEVSIFPDTGGYAFINLYHAGSAVVVQPMGNDEYHVDLKTGHVTTRPLGRPPDAKFLGAFDFDEDRRWTFMPATARSEKQVGVPDLVLFPTIVVLLAAVLALFGFPIVYWIQDKGSPAGRRARAEKS